MPVVIAQLGEIGPGASKKFVLTCAGRELEGFVVNVDGTHHAYVNRCRHVPMALDWVENQFFTDDGRWVQCATHGAYYEPATGEWVANEEDAYHFPDLRSALTFCEQMEERRVEMVLIYGSPAPERRAERAGRVWA